MWEPIGEWLQQRADRLPRPELTVGVLSVVMILGGASPEKIGAILGVEDHALLRTRAGDLGLIQRRRGAGDDQWVLLPVTRQAMLHRIRTGRMPRTSEAFDRLIGHLTEGGDHEAALRAAMAVEDWDRAAGFLREHFGKLMVQNPQVVRDFLEELPAEHARDDPLFTLGRRAFAGLDAGATAAVTTLARDDDILGGHASMHWTLQQLLTGATIRTVLLRLAGEFEAGARLSRRVADRTESATREEYDATVGYLPVLRGQWAIVHQLAGDLAAAEKQFRLSYGEAKAQGLDPAAKNAAGTLAMNDALRGEPTMARHWLAAERRYPDPEGWLGPRVKIPGQVAEAIIALDAMDDVAAGTAVEEMGMPDDTEEFWAPMISAHCAVLFHRGRLHEGLDLVDRARRQYARWAPAGSFAEMSLSVQKSDFLTALGRGNEALHVLGGLPQERASVRVRTARIHLLAGDHRTVSRILGDCTESAYWFRAFLEMLTVSAAARAALGDPDGARADLERAASAARQSGAVRPLLRLARMHRSRLLETVPVPEALRSEWEKHSGYDPFPQAVAMVSLTGREMAVLRLVAEGKGRRQIAADLFVSENTVKTQLSSIYRKLNVGTRDQAVDAARRFTLL